MAVITPVAIDTAGEAVTYAAASAGGDTVATSNKTTRFHVINGSASAVTLTFAGAVTCSQGALHPITVTIAAGATESVQVPSQCVNPATGNAAVTYSAVTTVTVAASQ